MHQKACVGGPSISNGATVGDSGVSAYNDSKFPVVSCGREPMITAYLEVSSLKGARTSIVKPTTCANVSNLFYFEMTLYMFRVIFPSIIRSSRLYIQQEALVKHILLSASKQTKQRYMFDIGLLLYVQA